MPHDPTPEGCIESACRFLYGRAALLDRILRASLFWLLLFRVSADTRPARKESRMSSDRLYRAAGVGGFLLFVAGGQSAVGQEPAREKPSAQASASPEPEPKASEPFAFLVKL
jgi:hypothetical protein